jgi:hypothetical protein
MVLGELSLEGRKSIDIENANKIEEILKKESGNLIVFYGVQHSIHDKDIDAELRKKGISVMIVDPDQGEWACKPGSAVAMGDTYACDDIKAGMRQTEKDIEAHGDPNRYTMPDVLGKPQEIAKRAEKVVAPVPGP